MAVYRLTFSGSTPGESFNFGLHVEGSAGASDTVASDAATAMTDWFTDVTDGLSAQLTADITIDAIHAAELSPTTGRQVDAHAADLALTGAASGDMLPFQIAVAVTLRGASANRKDRGRFYLPPLAQSTSVNGRLLNTVPPKLANGAAILINELQAAAWTPVIYHPDFTTTAVAFVDVGDVFDTQRRRRNKLVEVRSSVGV